MDVGMIRCMRCQGRKKVYKVRNVYSLADTGGVEIDCPLCDGVGKIKTLEKAIEDISHANEKTNPKKNSKKIDKGRTADNL